MSKTATKNGIKVTQLDRIEALAKSAHAEAGLAHAATLALQQRIDAMSESRSAPAEEWVPKVGDLVVVVSNAYGKVPVGDIGQVEKIDSDGDPWIKRCCFACSDLRPATEAEVSEYKAKEEQRAKEAEWAKYDVLQVDDYTEDPISEEGAEELANLGLPHYRGGYGNSHVGWCEADERPCIMGVGFRYIGQRLPEAEFLRRAKGTAAKRAEEERQKELAKPLTMGTPIKYRDREGLYLWSEGMAACRLALKPTDQYSAQIVIVKRDQFVVLDQPSDR